MNLLICAHDRPGSVNGPNVWLQRLLPELRKEGIETRLLFFPVGDPGKCPTLQALKNKKFPCEIYTGLKYTEHKIRWILKQVKVDPPDIFIPHLNIPAYFASRYIKDTGIPTIGILHSADSFYRSIVEEFIVKPDESYLSAVVCVSKFLENYCEEYINDKSVIRRIPCGVPIPEKKAQFNVEMLKLLYAGRFVERAKRITDVTKALCRVTSEVPGTEAVLYGNGPSESDMREIINNNNKARVKLGGFIDSAELQIRLLENQVFVLLSDYEGLPIALMEAMASGLVPICYKMESGIPELVTHGENGFIVENRDDDFLQAVQRLKNDKKLWEQLSTRARNKIKNSYSISVMTRKWIKLLKNLKKNAPEHKKSIAIPNKFDLPPRNPGIREYEDTRWPGYIRYYKSRVTNVVKRLTGLG